MAASSNSTAPSHQISACPRCDPNNQAYYSSDHLYRTAYDYYLDVRDYVHAAYAGGRRDYLARYADYDRRLLDGYIGQRTKFCFFVPVDSDKIHICGHKH